MRYPFGDLPSGAVRTRVAYKDSHRDTSTALSVSLPDPAGPTLAGLDIQKYIRRPAGSGAIRSERRGHSAGVDEAASEAPTVRCTIQRMRLFHAALLGLSL